MRYLGFVVFLSVSAGALSGAVAREAPEWVKALYCEGRANVAACVAGLTLEPEEGGEGNLPRLAHCEYITPEGRWDFSEPCFSTTRVNAFGSSTAYRVRNGSIIGIRVTSEGTTFNGLPARAVTYRGQRCTEAIATQEKFCTGPYRGALPAVQPPGGAVHPFFDRIAGRWETRSENCGRADVPEYGGYAQITPMDGMVSVAEGDHETEGGGCDITEAETHGEGILARGLCGPEDFRAERAELYLGLADGPDRLLIWNRTWNSATAYHRCD